MVPLQLPPCVHGSGRVAGWRGHGPRLPLLAVRRAAECCAARQVRAAQTAGILRLLHSCPVREQNVRARNTHPLAPLLAQSLPLQQEQLCSGLSELSQSCQDLCLCPLRSCVPEMQQQLHAAVLPLDHAELLHWLLWTLHAASLALQELDHPALLPLPGLLGQPEVL